jgi:ABC-type Fe3+ transport system substrate-binding protein
MEPSQESSGALRSVFRRVIVPGVLAAALSAAAPTLALTDAEVLNLKSQDRQKILEDGARKEGKVTWYTAMIVDQTVRPIADAFNKKYPYLKVEFWRGSSRQIVQKVTAEARARAVVGDVLEGSGLTEPMVQSNAVQPFYSPLFESYPAQYRHPENLWAATRFRYIATGYNTKLISADEAPKTYEDLLDPKWKGKMAWRAGADSGAFVLIANFLTTWGPEKTEAYLAKLSPQKIASVQGSNRTVVNRVIEGEYAIALGASAHHPIISKLKGAPVDSILMEPVPSLTGTVFVTKGVKNPHATMLFVDFLLGPEGQTILRESEYVPAHPEVGPSPELRSIVPHLAGKQENIIDPEGMLDEAKTINALIDKYFKE